VSLSGVEANPVDGDDQRLDVIMGQGNATHFREDVRMKAPRSISDSNTPRVSREEEKGKEKAVKRTKNPSPGPASTSSGRDRDREKIDKFGTRRGKDDVSLRELFRKAYSRESLHTYRADPLHRGKARPSQHLGGTRGTGRGQPDMKLRMNALLEKIKRDVAAPQ